MENKLTKRPEPNAAALSLNDTPVSDLTIAHAVKGPSLATIARDTGRPFTIDMISEEVELCNKMCGGGMDQSTVTMCAELIFDRFKYRTINALRIALRDGLNSGKIFGKLTYPLIGEWMTAHEEAVENYNYQHHIASK